MKKISVTGILFIILGVLIAAGPHSIFHVCTSEMAMKCNKTADVEIYLGILIVIMGILLFIVKPVIIRLIISVIGLISGVFTILVPTTIVGTCMKATMVCNRLTKPALIILGSFVILFGIINIIYLIRLNMNKHLEAGRDNEK